MSLRYIEAIDRIKSVEREHKATRFATEYLLNALRHDASPLQIENLRVRGVYNAGEQLEGTYLIRLFAEFETSLRSFLHDVGAKRPPARTRDLLDRVAAKCRISHAQIRNAHAVREYRNVLVHERTGEVDAVSLAQARSHLCRFLDGLANRW